MSLYIVGLFLFICFSSNVYASTITLKNGQTVTGEITNETDKMINISVNNTVVTYYMDEIASIDGKDMLELTKEHKEDPEEIKLARQIVGLMPMDEIINLKLMEGMPSQLSQEQKKNIISTVEDSLDVRSLDEARIRGMGEFFTVDELNAEVTLLSSPAGKSFLEKVIVQGSEKWLNLYQLMNKKEQEAFKKFKLDIVK